LERLSVFIKKIRCRIKSAKHKLSNASPKLPAIKSLAAVQEASDEQEEE
jgi:hypothetical protein